jgi:ABC-type multidrug transport system, ATPase component
MNPLWGSMSSRGVSCGLPYEKLKGEITIILTTHYMEEAEALSDRIGIMTRGRLQDVGTSAELIAKTGTKTFEDAFIALASESEVDR